MTNMDFQFPTLSFHWKWRCSQLEPSKCAHRVCYVPNASLICRLVPLVPSAVRKIKLLSWDKIGQAKSLGFRFYSAIWRSESRINSRYLEITWISLIFFFNFFEEERIIILAFPGFEPTHLGNTLDQRRFEVEGVADSATATQGGMENEK